TDEKQQGQYIDMFKAAKMDAVILTHNIDQPFVSQLEAKNEGIKFQRIDADLTDSFKEEAADDEKEALEKQSVTLTDVFKKALDKDKIEIKVEKLKDESVSSILTISEESRRMQDMMKMYSMPGMGGDMFGSEGETLTLNANHPLVNYILEHQDAEHVSMICEQLYDLAVLGNKPLSPEAMTKFVARSNQIMLLLTK
ncbi:MAG: molecular chaperone HtpG, partial [Clostridia bacterium]|nr:molecular chaperone HtpG [Clostridia bacterium]